jgi:hypothetical protein
MFGPPTGSALRVAGAWPSPESLLQRLIAELQDAAAGETREPSERSKFKQAAGWLGSFARKLRSERWVALAGTCSGADNDTATLEGFTQNPPGV